MKRSYLSFVALTLVLSACADDPIQPTARFTPKFSQVVADSRYLVDFNGQTPKGFAQTVEQLGGTVVMTHASGVGIVSGLTAEAAASLGATQGIGAVIEDVEVQVAPYAVAQDAAALDVSEVIAESQANPATALRYSFQWNLRAIGANLAWAAGKRGDPSVTVAILDTGLDYGNRDLAGLVDLARSISFVPADTDTLRRIFGTSWHPVTDLNGHGTNVAAQVSSMAFATAGVTSRTTLIGVKVLGQKGGGSLSGILQGLVHAVDADADVVNMSLGVKNGSSKIADGRYVSIVNKIFSYAHRKGTVVVVSAGNDAADMDHDGNTFRSYCDAPNVICVAATGPTGFTGDPYTGPRVDTDAPAVYTNFGRSGITVAAPGGNTGGYVWSFCARHALYPFGAAPAGPRLPCTGGGSLIGMAGTSQAAPHVAGLAALLVVEHGKNNPGAIKDVLLNTSDDLGAAGTDPYYGKGRINVKRALGL
jgi:lantibiotic leader peptide-processing serine protease